jgi:hypothetical protein
MRAFARIPLSATADKGMACERLTNCKLAGLCLFNKEMSAQPSSSGLPELDPAPEETG